jgi:hypothetical protein
VSKIQEPKQVQAPVPTLRELLDQYHDSNLNLEITDRNAGIAELEAMAVDEAMQRVIKEVNHQKDLFQSRSLSAKLTADNNRAAHYRATQRYIKALEDELLRYVDIAGDLPQ